MPLFLYALRKKWHNWKSMALLLYICIQLSASIYEYVLNTRFSSPRSRQEASRTRNQARYIFSYISISIYIHIHIYTAIYILSMNTYQTRGVSSPCGRREASRTRTRARYISSYMSISIYLHIYIYTQLYTSIYEYIPNMWFFITT